LVLSVSAPTSMEHTHVERNIWPHNQNAQHNNSPVVIARGTVATPDDDRLVDRRM
jgi:hypothetical protein